jgi:holo-[acyl-carrier protein] synthase
VIIGIGSDLCDIRRIEKTLERFGDRFTHKSFTEIERTGLKGGVHLSGMGVVNLPSGKPTMALTGGAAERLARMIPEGMTPVIHLSLTDDHPYAQAFVIIEAVPTI